MHTIFPKTQDGSILVLTGIIIINNNMLLITSAVQYQPKFAYHDTANLLSQYTLGIEY